MSIKIICDRCGDEDGALDDPTWRTIDVDLGYLPGADEHGAVATLFSVTLCYRCVEEILGAPEGPDIEAAILEAIR